MRWRFLVFAGLNLFAGCTSSHRELPAPALVPGSSPQPLPPIADVNPTRRHAASIWVPAGLRAIRETNQVPNSELTHWHFAFTGFEKAHLTVGYKMLTGVRVEIGMNRDGKPTGTYGSGVWGAPRLPSKVPTPGHIGQQANETPVECRITIFETDQPAGFHVDPEEGKYYRVLWTRAFEVAVE